MAEEKNKKLTLNIFEKLKEYCPYGVIFRKDISKITGGILNPHTMAQLDSRGFGIKNKKIIGRKVAYKIDDVIQWLEENTELIGFEEEKPVKKSQLSVEELLLMKKRVKRRTR
ncbi:MAG: hypothetical protein K5766_00065 [Alphaproteobacteria bacterium]|nr:hypothetical protein [Alphaproteobacteria bacterium]